jgi:hypothetical protein
MSEFQKWHILKGSDIYYKAKKFVIIWPDNFDTLRQMLNKGKQIHFFEYILDGLGLLYNEIKFPIKPDISDTIRTSLEIKIRRIGLNCRFIILFPEAATAQKLSDYFWKKLEANLKFKGYDIFVNTARGKGFFKKYCLLNLEELYELALRSCGMIALTSGIMVYLSALPVPKHIIYNSQTSSANMLNAAGMFKGYSLAKIPGAQNFAEYNIEDIPENELLNTLLEKY